jgi:hypothetical protein
MTDKPDGKPGWWAVVCSLLALTVVTGISFCRTPVEIAASRLRVGMTPKEVSQALSPEITYHPLLGVSWEGVGVQLRSGLWITFWHERLTGWEIRRPIRQ